VTPEVIGNIAALLAGRNPGGAQSNPGGTQSDDLERRNLLHAGRSEYRCGRIALNLSLQAVAETPSKLEPYSCA